MMMIFLTLLSWIGAILGGLLLLLLIAPIHVDGRGVVSSDAVAGFFRLRWAFGLLSIKGNTLDGVHLYLMGIRTFRLEGNDEKDKAKKPTKPKKERKQKAPLSSWIRWFRANSQIVGKIFSQFFAAFHLSGGVEGSIGLGDPSHTALLDLIRRFLGPMRGRLQINIWPNYMDDDIDLVCHGRAWIVCLYFLFLLLYWLLRSDTRRTLLRFPRAPKRA